VLGLLAFLGVQGIDTPFLGPLPLPTWLLIAGLVLGGIVSVAVHQAVNTGAARRRMVIAAQMRDVVQDVAWSHVIAPIAQVLHDHRTVREALNRAI